MIILYSAGYGSSRHPMQFRKNEGDPYQQRFLFSRSSLSEYTESDVSYFFISPAYFIQLIDSLNSLSQYCVLYKSLHLTFWW